MSVPIPFIIPRSRKGLKILMAVLAVVCLALAVFAYFSWTADQKLLKESGQPDFNTLKQDELKGGLIVKGKIDIALDYYAEEYDTNFGIRTDEDSETLYYVVPVYDEDEQGNIMFNYLLTYEAEPKDFETMDTIVEKSWIGEAGLTVLTVENARILDLPGDLKPLLTEWYENPEFYEGGTFIDWCAEMGVFGTDDRAVIASKITPYMIDSTDTAGTDPGVVWFLIGLAVVFLIILMVLIFNKAPIPGVVDPPEKDDFNKVKEFSGE